MVIVYGGLAICAAVIGTFALLELVTWWFNDDRRFNRRRLKRRAKSKKKGA